MHSKIARDYNDHDYYANNVKYVHYFVPIELGHSPSPYSAECTIGLPEVCIEWTSAAIAVLLERAWW
jgi:hypothetical protein